MKKTLFTGWFLLAFGFSVIGQADTAAVVREVDSLIQKSRKQVDFFQYTEALTNLERAKKLSLQALGENNKSYADCQFFLGRTFYLMRQFSKAEPCYLEAKIVRERLFGKNNADYAWVTNNLGLLYSDLGRYEQAEPLLTEAVSIRLDVLGPNHYEYANSLYNLAVLYRRARRYENAEPVYLESISVYEKSFGPDYIRIAWSLNGLGDLYQATHRYEISEKCQARAIEICRKNKQQSNPEYAMILVSLSDLYKNLGLYHNMEPLLLEAEKIQRENLGKGNLFYANTLNSLGNYYLEIGRFKEAERFYTSSLEIAKQGSNKDHFGYSTTLNNLALVYMHSREFKQAEKLLLELKHFEENSHGKSNPTYGRCLHNLGHTYLNTGRTAEAENMFREALLIWGTTRGTENIEYADGLKSLGDFYKYTENFIKADSCYRTAINITEKVVGRENRGYSGAINGLATLYYINKQYEKAGPLLLESNRINLNALEYACRFLSELELASNLNLYISTFDTDYSFGVDIKTERLGYFGNCYDNALFLKSFLLNTTTQTSIRAQKDTVAIEQFNRLKSYHRRLAAEYAKPIAERKNVAELEEKANTLEKELTRTVSGFGEVLRQVTWQEVQAALNPHEAAIEFIRFNYYNPKLTDSVLYAALLLKPGMATPAFIPLLEEKQLDALLSPLAAQGSGGPNELYGGKTGQALYRMLWKPLEAHLKGVKTVYFSPAGLLHRLNLEAIPTGKSKETIGKRHALSVLGSTRQLVVMTAAPEANTAAVVFGGILYDMDSTAITAGEPGELAGHRGLSFSQPDSALRSGAWKYLKYSEREAGNIQAQLQKAGLQASILKGYTATEEAFKQLGKDAPSPRILHISTHGFFFPDPEANPQSAIRNPQLGEPVFKISNHPMIRSGLIMAGANHAWSTGKPLGNREDGILTAYEISQMDLRHTELVVLSACETGLGDIRGNEGVYGLQRAFKIAGVKNLIMSLWQVPDFQTQELMTVFYQKWLSENMTVHQALKAAQEEMQRRRYEPFYWAGFVLVE